jgi:ABC-type glycerol-3-phosphate transport system substrate-binding protein
VVRVVQYNQTAFEAQNRALPSATWTLQDFVQAAEQLTYGTGSEKHYGFVGATPYDLFFFLDHMKVSTTRGSGIELRPNFTAPEVRHVIDAYLTLLRSTSPHKKLENYKQGQSSEEGYALFTQGRVGMMFSFDVTNHDNGGNNSFVTAVAPPPMGDGYLGPNDFFIRSLYISATTTKASACWVWLKRLSADLTAFSNGYPANAALTTSEVFAQRLSPDGIVPSLRSGQTHQQQPPSINRQLIIIGSS